MSRVLVRDIVRFYKGLPLQDAALVELDEALAQGVSDPMDRRQPWFATWSSAGKQAAMALYVNPGTPTEAGLRSRRAVEGDLWSQGLPKPPAPPQAAPAAFVPSSPFTMQITPHVTYGEFALYQEARRFVASHQCATARLIAEFLEKVRAEFGAPIEITSGYRPPAINRAVGGASQSEHLYDAPDTGAVDFLVTGKSIYAVQDWCDSNWPYSLGYGAPKGFVHLGIRPGRPRVRWDY